MVNTEKSIDIQTDRNIDHGNELESRVVMEVRTRTPGGSNYRIVAFQSRFLNGSLYTVTFDLTAPQSGEVKSYQNRVYVSGGNLQTFGNDEMLLSVLGQTHRKTLVERLLDADGVSGTVALILTLTICYLSVYDPRAEIPEILKNALTAILGFYFARQVTK